MNKEEKIKNFDPNDIADVNNNLFGLPFTCEEADVVIIPVPWEVTVSYSSGTGKGPEAVLQASYQVDLYDPQIKDAWKAGIAMEEISSDIVAKNALLRQKAEEYLGYLEQGSSDTDAGTMNRLKDAINKECKNLLLWVKERSLRYLKENKVVGILGGDHSTPLGMIHALAEKHESFAILQVDAHADLREAYEGFEFSHASIMYNALKVPQVSKLVQVGIRDYCDSEAELISQSQGRIHTFFDRDIKHMQYEGTSWEMICREVIKELPELVYLSFDIDGLDPKLCPNTGTPVPGGFEFEQAIYLIQKVVESGRIIVAFDINEISPGEDEWDANVGARLLYRIANLAAVSNGKHKFSHLNSKEIASS